MALLDINAERGEEIAARFQSQGGRAFFYRCDVRDQAECKSVVDRFVAQHCPSSGGVHTLFNNAATFLCKGLDATTADFERALMTNVAGYAHMVQGQHCRLESASLTLCVFASRNSTRATFELTLTRRCCCASAICP